jgi:hypothetical protein
MRFSSRSRAAFVKEGERTRSGFLVSGAKSLETKSSGLNKIINLSVKMAAAADPFPDGRYPVLPAHHVWIGRATMLCKPQFAFGFENSPDLEQSRANVRDGTQREGHHDRIKAPIFERQFLAGCFHQPHGKSDICDAPAGLGQKFGRGINAANGFNTRGIR